MKAVLSELWQEVPMKGRYTIFYTLGFISCAIPWLMSCDAVKNYPHDNLIEEIAEEAFKQHTGVEIDFTPSSEESERYEGTL